jgi:hypothetical protein
MHNKIKCTYGLHMPYSHNILHRIPFQIQILIVRKNIGVSEFCEQFTATTTTLNSLSE